MDDERSKSKYVQKGIGIIKGIGHLLACTSKQKGKRQEWPPGDVKPGQEEAYATWLMNFGDQNIYEKELMYCCHTNLPIRLDILCNHLKGKDLNIEDIKNEEKLTWLIYATCNNSVEVTKVLIKHADKNLIMAALERDQYSGVTALHSAVANKMTDVITEMLHKLEREDQIALIHHHTTGKEGLRRSGGSSLALNLSCWVCCPDIFEELVNRGAELDLVDKQGSNVIHTLVQVSTTRPEEAIKMVKKVVESEATRKWYCRRFDVEENYWTTQEDKDLKKHLLSVENHDGYTPLTLAAKLGSTEMLDFIINCEGVYRNTMWKFGLDYSVQYDVTEINPYMRQSSQTSHFTTPNVMNLLIYRSRQDIDYTALEAFLIPVIRRLISIKWKWYRVIYIFWAIMHIIMMLLCFYIPLTYISGKDAFFHPRAERTLPMNATILDGTIYTDHMSSTTQIIFFTSLALILAWMAFCMGCAIYDSLLGFTEMVMFLTRKWHGRYYNAPFPVIVKFDLFRIILVIFLLSETFVLKELFVNATISYGLTCTAFISGWGFLLFFLQGFRMTGYFSVIMHHILFTDLVSFGFVIIIIQFAFGTAMFYLVNDDSGDIDHSERYQDLAGVLYTMSKIMYGYANEPDVLDAGRQRTIHVIFMFFLTLSSLLLLNMLIAAMSNTYSELSQYQEQLWLRSRAGAMLLMERQFFRCLSKFMNNRCLTYDENTDRWFFQIETQVPPT